MELFIFGPQRETRPSVAATTPMLRAKVVKVLWSSWCDAVVLTQDDEDNCTVEYTGIDVPPSVADHVHQAKYLRSAFNGEGVVVNFFGSTLHDGLRGYVISSLDGKGNIDSVVLFATDDELENGHKAVHAYSVAGDHAIMDVKILSGGDILLSTRARADGAERIIRLESVAELRKYLDSDSLSQPQLLASSVPVQWCTNATTSTALMPDARVYTYTSDPRYPKCLGRPYERDLGYEIIPFLSEMDVIKIASGGYLSAALSADGELYLWGQVCPDSAGKLQVLEESTMSYEDSSAEATCVDVDGEQDEFVKCLRVRINGHEASVYDFSIGHGHIWIAAEVMGHQGREGAVFVAGDNSRGQLGPGLQKDFVEDSQEINFLRNAQVVQITAAGWTTYVAT
ncbi:hypothetical protein NX059_008321 [Plenodomus lindquistii]|nr:hypothetical protein NX059_008321 [Plenodomus lindquistii]